MSGVTFAGSGVLSRLLLRASRHWRLLLFFFLVGLGSACLGLVSCVSSPGALNEGPHIPGAHYVGNKGCADCHGAIVQVAKANKHSRLIMDRTAPIGSTSCEGCHGPGSKHIESGGGKGKFILNPSQDGSICLNCHQQVNSEFHMREHHAVLEGRMNCVSCHDPHGPDLHNGSRGFGLARVNSTCAQCHREQTKLTVFDHEAMREGCTVCHAPHGSVNSKMLLQRDNNLCLKCHAQVQTSPGEIFIGATRHTSLLAKGSCWSAGCHTAVHGSNIDSHLRY